MTTPDDPDRTLLAINALGGNALPVGTRVGEFEILSLLGEGGFGIVYLAYDSSLKRKVALKEYMPAAFASRSATQVSVKSSQHEETFHAGLRSFVNEARILAQFDHPALIKVYRFWEANGTAYMVMPYYQGSTLKQVLQSRTGQVDEAWLKSLLAPLLHTLALIHEQQCFHRDISPDNIMILEDGRPLLLDFGAARQAIGGMQQAFTAFFKLGYAPVEQYADVPGMVQGPWTDLFALASVIHFAIDGKPPPPAIGRLVADNYEALASRYAKNYSIDFLKAIDSALSVKPEQRPQSVQAMLALLHLHAPPAPAALPPTAQPLPAVPQGLSRAHWIGVGIGLGAVVLSLTLIFVMRETRDGVSSPVQAAAVAAPPVQNVVPSTVTPPPAPERVAAAPFDPLAAMAKVVEGASAARAVSVKLAQKRVRIGHDRLTFSVTASHAGYLYVQMLGSDKNHFWLIFPNAIDKNNHIGASQTVHLPRSGWRMGVAGPPGVDEFVVILSDVPRDFSTAGLVVGELFGEFPIARAADLQREYTGSAPLFAGEPMCESGANCSALYGASSFSIEEYTR